MMIVIHSYVRDVDLTIPNQLKTKDLLFQRVSKAHLHKLYLLNSFKF